MNITWAEFIADAKIAWGLGKKYVPPVLGLVSVFVPAAAPIAAEAEAVIKVGDTVENGLATPLGDPRQQQQ